MYKKEILKEAIILEPTKLTGDTDLSEDEWKTVCKLFGFGAKSEEIYRIEISAGTEISIGKNGDK